MNHPYVKASAGPLVSLTLIFTFSDHPPQLCYQNIFNFHKPFTQLLYFPCQQRTWSFITSKISSLRVIFLKFLPNMCIYFHMHYSSEVRFFFGFREWGATSPVLWLFVLFFQSLHLYWLPAQPLYILYTHYIYFLSPVLAWLETVNLTSEHVVRGSH